MHEFVKVFGERNSGTNFLNLTLEANGVSARILNKEPDYLPAGWVNGFAEQDRAFFIERYLDRLDRQEFKRNFGWKHARVSVERLSGVQMFPRTFFIFLVRNPFNFVASLHRRAYNLLPSVRPDRKAFIRSPLIANERDHLDAIYLANPVELWNQKTLSYIDFVRKVGNACLVRYEDLIADPAGFIDWVSAAGPSFSTNCFVPAASTKDDALGFADYRANALGFDPRSEFDAEDFDFLQARITDELARCLGYDKGATTFPAQPWRIDRFSYLAA